MSVVSYTYKRNPDVVTEALLRAKGVCDNCGKPALLWELVTARFTLMYIKCARSLKEVKTLLKMYVPYVRITIDKNTLVD